MKMIAEVLLFLGFIKIIMGCNCHHINHKWSPLNQPRLMYTNISGAVADNCNSAVIHVQTQNTLGPITAGQLHIEGEYNGLPLVFIDPHACELTRQNNDEDDRTVGFVKEITHAICTHSEMKEFQIGMPLSDDEKSLFEAFEGDYKYKFCLKNINKIENETFCAEATGTIVCK